MRAAVLFFCVGFGLTLWDLSEGSLPGAEHDTVMTAYIVAYAAMFVVVVWQFRRGEILRNDLGGLEAGELACCGIKWSTLFGYIFTLFTAGLIVALPFWVMSQIGKCKTQKDSHLTQHQCVQKQIGVSGLVGSAAFAVLALVFGVREIVKHWLNYYQSQKQRHIVRVLIMVPVYALDAFMTLYLCFGRTDDDGKRVGCQGEDNYQTRLFLETFRELYEAYTIYSFFTFLVECLHDKAVQEDHASRNYGADGIREQMAAAAAAGERAGRIDEPLLQPRAAGQRSGRGAGARQSIVAALGLAHEDLMYACLHRHNPNGQPHPWWSGVKCFLSEWKMGEVWLRKCWNGVLAYVVVEVFFAVVLLATRVTDRYGEGCLFPWTKCSTGGYGYQYAYTYLTFVVSVAQMYALYCLWMFYHATSTPLDDINPGAKFVSIKAIVFLTYWQGVGLGMAQEYEQFQAIAAFVGLCPVDDSTKSWLQARCQADDSGAIESLATGMQAVLICLEMFGAAIVHRTVFSYKDYKIRANAQTEMAFWPAVKHSLDPRIVVQQVSEYAGIEALKQGAGGLDRLVNSTVERAADRFHGGDRLLRDDD
jgi:hypothetical protein